MKRTIVQEVEINGKKVALYQWGEQGKPLVLLVHGWSGRSGQFYKFIPELLVNDYHVIAFDAPAHGRSKGRRTNILEFVEVIQYISEKFGPIYSGIGHSIGGAAIMNAYT